MRKDLRKRRITTNTEFSGNEVTRELARRVLSQLKYLSDNGFAAHVEAQIKEARKHGVIQ